MMRGVVLIVFPHVTSMLWMDGRNATSQVVQAVIAPPQMTPQMLTP